MTILVVDDEHHQRTVLAGFLRKKSASVLEAASADEGLAVVRREHIDIVLTDFRMPDKTGLDFLKEIREVSPETTVVLMTAYGTIEGAVGAMRAGAYDYLTKPIDLGQLELLIERAGERQKLISENRLLKEQLAEKFTVKGIIAQSSAMEEVLTTVGRVAGSKASVLIRGESGTGKEVVAKAIHFASSRKKKPFVAVNCAALNENLLESELFGHERGAFTGAEKQRQGRFELADGGTLFLDEVGDIPPATQVKLLRVLQEQSFERVGGAESIHIDVRVVAATNRNLEERISQGAFREDLFYRLNVVTIAIPPLRDRREDIAPALDQSLKRYAQEHGRPDLSFSREAWDQLLRYDYPGNMRELENIVQRAVILAGHETITTGDLPSVVKKLEQESATPPSSSLPDQVERLEKELIMDALRVARGNQSRAAKELGISERNLRYKLKKWNIT